MVEDGMLLGTWLVYYVQARIVTVVQTKHDVRSKYALRLQLL